MAGLQSHPARVSEAAAKITPIDRSRSNPREGKMLLFPPQPESFVTERRRTLRFPLRASVKYELADRIGAAVTFDISRCGMSLLTNTRLPAGSWIRLRVDWPVRLNGYLPLHLVVQGMVLRSTTSQATIGFSRYEFRLQAPRPPSPA